MQNTTIKGFLYAALSSSTFGLAPFFSISLLVAGFSSFEVLTYRWGIASLILAIAGIILGERFRITGKDWQTVFILSLFRATTSFSLVIAYQNIASGVASTIHFMYPLAVALTMMLFFKEKKSFSILFAVFISLIGAALLSSGEIDFKGGDTATGLIAAAISIFSYGGYIIGVKPRCQHPVYGTDLLCHGIRNPILYYRRLSDRRHPTGNRRPCMAEHPRTGNTGNGRFQYQSGKGNQTCRPHAYIHLRSIGTSDRHNHRMLRIQRKLHMEQRYRNRPDCDGSDSSHPARKRHGQSAQVILLRPLIIRDKSFHHPLCQSLAVGADNETTLVERILDIAQFHKNGSRRGFQQYIKVA